MTDQRHPADTSDGSSFPLSPLTDHEIRLRLRAVEGECAAICRAAARTGLGDYAVGRIVRLGRRSDELLRLLEQRHMGR